MWDDVQIRWRPSGVPSPAAQWPRPSVGDGQHETAGVREPEWLVTNGLGGFAAGTALGLQRRRYHGLLVAALQPPVRRHFLWAKNEEWLLTPGGRLPLSANDYGDVIYPDGWRRIHGFHVYPFPTTVYFAQGTTLTRTVFMVYGQNTTVVLYRVHTVTPGVELFIEPLINFRDYHHTARARPMAGAHVEGEGTVRGRGVRAGGSQRSWDEGSAVVMNEGAPELVLGAGCSDPKGAVDGVAPRLRYDTDPEWYYNFHYAIERQRGLDFVEDHFRPGVFRWKPRGPGDELALVGDCAVPDDGERPPWREGGDRLWRWARQQYEKAVARRAAVAARGLSPRGHGGDNLPCDRSAAAFEGSGLIQRVRLVLAADDFVAHRRTTGAATIMAGYPWFADWGRDAMISLPGLLLTTGRLEEAKEVLLTFAAHRADGLIPNRFPDDGGDPLFNAVDASLWFVWAAWHYIRASGDVRTLKTELLPVMEDILTHYARGTRHGIGMDGDGLVRASEPGLQLTWMDAKAGDWVVTPRAGAPVEVNALWYNALRTVATLSRRYGRSDGVAWDALARKVRRAFLRRFVLPGGRLRDVASGLRGGNEMRPNQIFATSLPYPVLPRSVARRVVRDVGRHLLTPMGLRTLVADDPGYVGQYGGDQRQRDGAYHQGTVWPWLLGAFVDGWRRFEATDSERRAEDGRRGLFFVALEAHLSDEAALGHVSEIFAGDPPHGARGCFAQAWSVAEWLRVWDPPRPSRGPLGT